MVVRGSAGKAVVELDLDDKDFKNKTGQAAAGLESQMKSLGGAVIGVVGALGLVAAAKGAVDMLTGLAKKAVEVADSFEMMEKQLITLTKSEAKAKAFFEAIKDFARETPYQVRDLAQSFNMLYPIFKDKTVPMMKLIGDTAAGTGRSFQDTASAMMRMATGDWGVEIMRQLFLVKADFEGMFGPTGTLIVSQEEAWGKLEEILGERFGGMMVSMMDTVQGKVSNLKDMLDSLGNAVGAELTPTVKDFLDLLIEAVKEAEETGVLQEAAAELAETFKENRDLMYDIVGLLPEMINLLAAVVKTLGAALDTMGDINEEWGAWTGTGRTAVEDLGNAVRTLTYALAGSVAMFVTLKEKGIRTTIEDLDRALAEVEARFAPEAEIERWGPFQLWGPRAAAEEERGYRPPTKVRAAKRPRRIERVEKGLAGVDVLAAEEKAAAEIEIANAEIRKRREEREKEELKRVRELAETYAEYLDPTSYIIAGFKSGDMKQAISDFAVSLGTRVAEELVHKLIVMGIMAILQAVTGGGMTPLGMGPMGRGGIIKAATGLLGVLPPIPGGWHIPFGDKLVNAAEMGQPEAWGIFPRGRAGQDLILGPLARMFNIPVIPPAMVNVNAPPAPNVSVETRPVNKITVNLSHDDRHNINVHNRAAAGKVNKAVTVRE